VAKRASSVTLVRAPEWPIEIDDHVPAQGHGRRDTEPEHSPSRRDTEPTHDPVAVGDGPSAGLVR
jgi:hypothetical protein